MFKNLTCLFFGLCFCFPVWSQSVISGIINQYAAVAAFDNCRNSVTVSSAAGFQAGGQALLIQMQGASINTTNSADFGDVVNLQQAGRYEKVVIRSVAGNEIVLQNKLLYTYDLSGAVQLVTMPVYNRVVVSSALQARPWDGATGGVIALDARDTLTLQADIDASAAGFRGGKANIQGADNCSFLNSTRIYGVPLGDWRGAAKGEGVAKWIMDLEAGRGPQANGGGGGNDHNSGGGGGGNVTAGGRGGRNAEPSFFGCSGNFPGEGGKVLPADTARVYLGGGGGAGDENNDVSSGGGNGGGIVILATKVIVGNGFAIRANGANAEPARGLDGAGGGGGGGSIVLAGATLVSPLLIEAKGGNGGNINNLNQDRCFGPGGGGAGGRYLGPPTWAPTVDLSGGTAGASLNSISANCGSAVNLALDGAAGLRQNKTGLPAGQLPFVEPRLVNIADLPPACEGGAWQARVGVEGDGLQLQWQIRQGAAFVDLNAGSPYSGTRSGQLRVNPVLRDLDGAQYRLKATTACGDQLFSDPIDLKVDERPTAAFGYSQNEMTVAFTNRSEAASSFLWLFGDGAQSVEQSPAHTYRENGNYEATLIARNDCGADTLRQLIAIDVGMAPQAAFSFAPASGCAPLQIQFTNESTGDYTSLQWRFLGGTPAASSEENPLVTYTQSGTYTFALVVIGPEGQDVLMIEEQIEVRQIPVADFTFVVNAKTVAFRNNSTNGDAYRWSFGDGAEDSAANPSHTYAAAGDYPVTLITTNECGADTTQAAVRVGLAPQAAFSFSPTAGCSPLQVQFSNESIGDFSTIRWHFPGGRPETSTDLNPTITYDQSGTYAFTLVVAGALGQDSLRLEQTLEARTPPVAAFSFTTEGRTVYFQNNSTGADAYTWLFGDGEEDSAPIPKHTYPDFGVYDATLIAANACGRDTFRTTVSIGRAPRARYSLTPAGGCAPVEIRFSNQSTGNFTRFEWTFPGGQPAVSNDPNPVVRYETPGSYGFTLYVEGPLGEDLIAVEHVVEVYPTPQPAFTYELRGDTLILQNKSTNAQGYRWNFGDGTTSREENPVHIYGRSGPFDVTLNATNPYCGKSTSRQINVVITSAEEALRAAGISLYPNPTDDRLRIDAGDRRYLPLRIALINSMGQRIEQWELRESGTISLARYPAGLYYLLVQSEQGRWTSRVIKQ